MSRFVDEIKLLENMLLLGPGGLQMILSQRETRGRQVTDPGRNMEWKGTNDTVTWHRQQHLWHRDRDPDCSSHTDVGTKYDDA